jgi:formylglycine-generating enzyme required for sulfatase activity
MGSFTRDAYFGDSAFADYPVVWVTRNQAAAYCVWAGAMLPTEAQWEYAARGPESRTYPWGDEFDPTRANYCDVSCASGVVDPSYNDGYPETAPVGSFPSGVSWCGALDMAGNVREWVADWFGYFGVEPLVNPAGPDEGETTIPKGGCWLDSPGDLRSSNRGQNTPDYTRHKVGFRCSSN